MLRRLLAARRDSPRPAIPAGQRVYAVGDVHGRLDLLNALLSRIDADEEVRAPAETALVFLGDLVDRGPDSAGVVERLRRLARDRPATTFLLGNHEEVLLLALGGDREATRLFCRIGGRETLMSYGVSEDDYEAMDHAEIGDRLRALIPAEHRAFLQGFDDLLVVGDYAFAHAGVRPGATLDAQRVEDLRWIRQPFLDHRGRLDKVIVHGHTIRAEVEMLPHRIGIDTGAYATGRLTALGLEGTDRWLIEA